MDFYNFFLAEMLPLVPFAIREYNRGGILMSDYNFKVSRNPPENQRLWYLPNEVNRVTAMLSSDY